MWGPGSNRATTCALRSAKPTPLSAVTQRCPRSSPDGGEGARPARRRLTEVMPTDCSASPPLVITRSSIEYYNTIEKGLRPFLVRHSWRSSAHADNLVSRGAAAADVSLLGEAPPRQAPPPDDWLLKWEFRGRRRRGSKAARADQTTRVQDSVWVAETVNAGWRSASESEHATGDAIEGGRLPQTPSVNRRCRSWASPPPKTCPWFGSRRPGRKGGPRRKSRQPTRLLEVREANDRGESARPLGMIAPLGKVAPCHPTN
jgi:hypothetical protein